MDRLGQTRQLSNNSDHPVVSTDRRCVYSSFQEKGIRQLTIFLTHMTSVSAIHEIYASSVQPIRMQVHFLLSQSNVPW